FSGEGKRPVKVSYVVENPIWKTSYRLMLGEKGKLYLQGWAVVENPSDEDWNNLRLSLVSGRPISFQMDLYQPLYVPRPSFEPELFAWLGPKLNQDAMTKRGAVRAEAEAAPKEAPAEAKKALKDVDNKGGDMAELARKSLGRGLLASGAISAEDAAASF